MYCLLITAISIQMWLVFSIIKCLPSSTLCTLLIHKPHALNVRRLRIAWKFINIYQWKLLTQNPIVSSINVTDLLFIIFYYIINFQQKSINYAKNNLHVHSSDRSCIEWRHTLSTNGTKSIRVYYTWISLHLLMT